MCFEYHRVAHLILLIMLLVLYVVSLIPNLVFRRYLYLERSGWAFAVLLFLLFWVLRGRLCMRWSYPVFHIGTLLVEWIFALFAFLIYCLYLFDVAVLLKQHFLLVNLAIGAVTLLIASVYFMLFILYAH